MQGARTCQPGERECQWKAQCRISDYERTEKKLSISNLPKGSFDLEITVDHQTPGQRQLLRKIVHMLCCLQTMHRVYGFRGTC